MQRILRRVFQAALVIALFSVGTPRLTVSQGTTLNYLPIIARTYTLLTGQTAGVWTQEGGNPQRTGYTAIDAATPWSLQWTWNASTATGGANCPDGNPEHGHCYGANKQPYSVAGAGLIFVPAGSHGLYALDDRTGRAVWHVTGATFNASPAYAAGSVYAGSADGRLFKIDVGSGAARTYSAGSPLNRGVLIAVGAVFALAEDGRLR